MAATLARKASSEAEPAPLEAPSLLSGMRVGKVDSFDTGELHRADATEGEHPSEQMQAQPLEFTALKFHLMFDL
jgi:hypothetical protein